MKNPNLQLLIYGPNAGLLTYSISYPGVKLVKSQAAENKNFAFLDLTIATSAKPGKLEIVGRQGNTVVRRTYELKARDNAPKGQGLTSADFIYLLMPDRFSGADASNDKFADMADKESSRDSPFLRHGGDLQGASNHLDYLNELGVTALWMTPVLENNQPQTNEGGAMRSAYHGYGFTDHYAIDRRFGGNEVYKGLVKKAHAMGMRVVQDAVYNHVGINHWFLKDMPSKDWLHQWPTYTNTSYKQQPITDPYASEIDRKVTVNGWFVPFLPDLNQSNPFLANYLIQNAIWCVEEFAIDAWRVDTYLYNDMPFMNRCNQALMDQYPNILIFGESSVGNVVEQAYYVRNKVNYPFKSNQPGGLDFVLYSAITNNALKQKEANAFPFYETLSQDVVYSDPTKLVTFLDNHDLDRYFSVIGEDVDKYKIGLTWLLTTRGIPSLYYGTEILMKNFKDPSDAEVRRDFPGGFPGDKDNKFTANGRNKAENDAFDFVKKLANYRKNTPTLHSGKLMQFLPESGTYTYFRYDNKGTVMVATNQTDKPILLDMARFRERTAGFNRAKNVLTGETLTDLKTVSLPAKTAVVLELQR